MRQAEIYYKNRLAGILTEGEDGDEFRYSADYLDSERAKPVSLTLPLQDKPFTSNILFPFFDGTSPFMNRKMATSA